MLRVIVLFAFITACVASKVSYDGFKVFRVIPQRPHDLRILESLDKSKKFDVWQNSRLLNQPWDIMVSPSMIDDLESVLHLNKISYKIFIKNLEKVLDQSQPVDLPKSGGISFKQYNRYDTIVSYLQSMAREHSDIATLINIGKSYEGRDIFGLKISSGGSNKPAILVDCGIHAREWLAPAQGLYIINQLVENPDNAHMFKEVDWYVIPSLNPDGYEYTHTTNRMWRKTRSQGKICRGVDPNRNFGFHWNENGASDDECDEIYAGPNAFSEPETQALRNFTLQHASNIKLYLTFHSCAQMILYPWGWTEAYPENHKELQSLGDNVNKAIKSVRGTNYIVGSSTNVLYEAAGGSDDWVMGVAGVSLSYTIELPCRNSGFQPPASEIAGVVQETFEGVKVYHIYVQNHSG